MVSVRSALALALPGVPTSTLLRVGVMLTPPPSALAPLRCPLEDGAHDFRCHGSTDADNCLGDLDIDYLGGLN